MEILNIYFIDIRRYWAFTLKALPDPVFKIARFLRYLDRFIICVNVSINEIQLHCYKLEWFMYYEEESILSISIVYGFKNRHNKNGSIGILFGTLIYFQWMYTSHTVQTERQITIILSFLSVRSTSSNAHWYA